MNCVEINFLKYFPQKLLIFPPNFVFLDMQARNNFQNVIFIACKWCKISKYNVSSMIISCSIWVRYLIYAVLSQFQICHNLRAFSAKSVFPKFQSSQKKWFFPSLQCTLNHFLGWDLEETYRKTVFEGNALVNESWHKLTLKQLVPLYLYYACLNIMVVNMFA